jgi:murein DD-endopeptidase MepM/ murein hydrolase activator NlpD
MKRDGWLWLGLGVGVLILVGGRKRAPPPGSLILGSPVEVGGAPKVTPRGHSGASRDGPPVHTHQGVDLAAPPGSRVLAVGDGLIVATNPGLGLVVRKLKLDAPGIWLDENGGRLVDAVVYADLGKPLVSAGDRVKKGDPIALVDKRGFVHFAVKEFRRSGEVFFDPMEAGFAYRLTSKTGVV